VIKNIQDAQYESRYHYSALRTPEFSTLCKSIGLTHRAVSNVSEFAPALDAAMQESGPIMLEVEMTKIGPFAKQFAGPPAGAAGKN
jgi:acetolactate synthase-1/2/3 large subunit